MEDTYALLHSWILNVANVQKDLIYNTNSEVSSNKSLQIFIERIIELYGCDWKFSFLKFIGKKEINILIL